MKRLLKKFTHRLVISGLVEPGDVLFGMADDRIVWNRPDPAQKILTPLFSSLNINSVLFARPAFPYLPIIEFLANTPQNHPIMPQDCETRTFLHDLPVATAFSTQQLVACLKTRKSVIIPGAGIVTTGTISPEQALVTFCSVCFACFVKFYSDFLCHVRSGAVLEREVLLFHAAKSLANRPIPVSDRLMQGPFFGDAQVWDAMAEAGKHMVEAGLVDSSFGNISYLSADTLYISQTGAFLDALPGFIDACPMDGSKCTGITASSELPAHMNILSKTGDQAVLHGHPLFSVIMSMACDIEGCEKQGECHRACPYDRHILDIPVVSGEVGSGPYGLCNTVACKMGENGVIVYGHGVFTTGKADFVDATRCLASVENNCKKEYFSRVSEYAGFDC